MIEKIGKYEIAEQIGVGGFGAVYRGRDPFIKRTVAVKTCQVNDDEIKNRFFREAELAGNLHHKNITTIYDFGVENGIPYIVQEFLTGEDLDKQIKRGLPIPLQRKVEILMAIAEGLEYAHNASIIHRDIKPANIRLLENGTVKIMDFGIAKSLETESNLTQTGITLGTSAYLAPEQIRGEPVDRRTDIFAYGVLAYELLTYRKPFRGEHLSTVLYKILNETPEPIPSLAADVPASLAAIVDRAIEKEMAKRYPSMDALHRDLLGIYRDVAGNSARFATIARFPSDSRTVPRGTVPSEDDHTVATPNHGMESLNITPPSGALARVPAPSEPIPRPTTAPTSSRPTGAGLELVNFRGTGEHASADAPFFHVEQKRMTAWLVAAGVVAAAAIAAVFYLQNRGPSVPVASGKTQAAPAAARPAELPTPELGVDAPPAAPTAAPVAQAPPAVVPAAQKPAARFPVQLSSVPSATIFVDGREIGPSVPAKTVELSEGPHEVRFAGAGLTHTQRIKVGARGETRLHFTFPVGHLVIRADPSWQGASVIVDGKYKTTVSSAPIKMLAGSYNVTLHRAEFQPVQQQITIPKGREAVWTPPPAVPIGPDAN